MRITITITLILATICQATLNTGIGDEFALEKAFMIGSVISETMQEFKEADEIVLFEDAAKYIL